MFTRGSGLPPSSIASVPFHHGQSRPFASTANISLVFLCETHHPPAVGYPANARPPIADAGSAPLRQPSHPRRLEQSGPGHLTRQETSSRTPSFVSRSEMTVPEVELGAAISVPAAEQSCAPHSRPPKLYSPCQAPSQCLSLFPSILRKAASSATHSFLFSTSSFFSSLDGFSRLPRAILSFGQVPIRLIYLL